MQVEVRLLGPDDLDLLLGAEPDVFDLPCRRDLAEAFLADPRHHLAGAIEHGRLVGMAEAVECLRPDKPSELFIAELGVTDAGYAQLLAAGVACEGERAPAVGADE